MEPLRFDLATRSSDEVRRAISELPVVQQDDKQETMELTGLSGEHAFLMRVDRPLRIEAKGPLGDYAFAHHAEATVRLTGDAGNGLGEGMRSGILRINGNAKAGVGTAMRGGTLAVYGSVGNHCGAAMRGGEIFVRGNVGDHVGVGALGGTIVVGGDAGHCLGNATSNVTIFLRGKAASLVDGVTEAPLRKREQLRLGLLLINASIRGDASEFRRIVPAAKLAAETMNRGEVVPNWR